MTQAPGEGSASAGSAGSEAPGAHGSSGPPPAARTGRPLRKALAWGLKALAAAACIAFVIRKVPWQAVGPTLRQCDFTFILFSILLQYAAAAANAFRWKALLRQPGIRLHKFLYFVLLGQFFNLFLPSYVAGEAVKVIAFGRKYGGIQENIGIALFSKATGMLVQMLMGGVGLLLYWRELRAGGLFGRLHLEFPIVLAAAAAVAALAGAVWGFRRSLKAQTWVRTIMHISRDRRLLATTLFWTTLIQFLAAASSYCLFLSLYPEARFWHVVLFTTIILAVLSLPVGFGGVGVREYMNLLLFTDVGGIPAHITFAVGILGYIPVVGLALSGGAWMAFRKLRP